MPVRNLLFDRGRSMSLLRRFLLRHGQHLRQCLQLQFGVLMNPD